MRPQTGQNMVEFALVMSLFLTMVLGLVDFGRAFYTHVGLTNAAREGARRAAMLPVGSACTGTDLTAIRNRVKAEQPGLGITDGVIVVDCSQADRRTVTIQNYQFVLASPFLDPIVGDGSGNVLLTTWATLPVLSS